MSTPGWVVVLGASSGFGAAIAEAFAAKGYPILGVHLDLRATRERADAVKARCEAHGVPVVFYNGNAADERHRGAALDALREADATPRVDVLVHSLAFGTLKPFTGPSGERMAPRALTMTVEVMAHSLVWWTQELLDAGALGHGSRIFALTSSGSLVAFPDYGAVSAAKSALESHVRQLAVELAPKGITANAIMAGLCRTPALDVIPQADALATQAAARNPSGRLTEPADVARCITALASPDTAWMTGNVIRVDGGETIAV